MARPFPKNPKRQTPRLLAFFEYVKSRKCEATARTYTRGALLFDDFVEERGITLEQSPPGLPDLFVGWLQDSGKRPNTIAIDYSGARAYMEWRAKQGETIPVFSRPDLPKVVHEEAFVLDAPMLRVFFDTADQALEPIRSLLILTPLCGLRCFEMTGLELHDVKVDKGWVFFDVYGKGRKRRMVPLLKQGNVVLSSYLAGWRAGVKDSRWLFPGRRIGKAITTRMVRKTMEQIRLRIGIDEEKFTPHCLRKTYMTMLDDAGVSPFKIAQLGGHQKVETSRDHYIRHTPAALASSLSNVRFPSPGRTERP